MKKLIAPFFILVAALSTASIANAQTAGLSGGTQTVQTGTAATGQKARANRQKMMAEVLAKLNLTDDQKAKIKELQTKNQAAQKELRAQVKAGTVQKADAAKKRQEMSKENQKALRAILTKDQAKQYAALMKEAREKAKEAKGGATTTTTGTTGTKGGGN